MKKLILIALLSLGVSSTASAFNEAQINYCEKIGVLASTTSSYVQDGRPKNELLKDIASVGVTMDGVMSLVVIEIYKIPADKQNSEITESVFFSECLKENWSPY